MSKWPRANKQASANLSGSSFPKIMPDKASRQALIVDFIGNTTRYTAINFTEKPSTKNLPKAGSKAELAKGVLQEGTSLECAY